MKKTLLLAFVSMFALQAHASAPELIDAVKNNNISKVLELLNNQENPNGLNEQGNTALHYAVALDNADMTQILLSYGADLNATNLKGWTPLKIAEKKDLKKVTPVLVQYLQLQKQFAADEEKNSAAEAVAEVKEKAKQVSQKIAEEAAKVPETVVAEVKEVPQKVAVEENKPQEISVAEVSAAEVVKEVPTITESQYINMVNEAGAEIAKAKYDKEQAEQKVIALQTELMKTIAEKENLAKSLDSIAKEKADTPKVEEKEQAKPAVQKKEPVKTVSKKPAPKPVKPVLKKKPVYHTPQPIVKKVVISPSTMVEGIYAGDEEIVYCLDYLGNGENDSMKRAAGYFAASASISEARYKQIVDKANDFFMKANAEDMTKRDNECSKVITPKDNDKQNQIVRSMNKSVGY